MTAKIWTPPAIGFPSGATGQQVIDWIENFRQAMLEIGLVQTADTGQFDPATFVYTPPTAADVVITYLMFAFDDALQATAPIFIKVTIYATRRHGTGNYTGGLVTVGSQTDGAGNVTGSDAVVFTTNIGTTSTTTSTMPGWSPGNPSYASYSKEKGFAGCMFSPGMNGFSTQYFPIVGFLVERIPDESGTPTERGITIFGSDLITNSTTNVSNTPDFPNAPVMFGATVLFGDRVYKHQHPVPFFPSNTINVSPANADVYFMPGYHFTPEPIRANGFGAIARSLPKGTEFDVLVYGVDPSRFISMDYTTAWRPCAASVDAYAAFLFE
jgi:hypothetical protein